MTYLSLFFNPVFELLNLDLTIPVDFNNTFITFKLYYIIIITFTIYLIHLIWSALVD